MPLLFILQILCIITIIIFVFSQDVYLKLLRDERISLEISFTFLSFSFDPRDKKKRNNNNKQWRASAFLEPLTFLLSRSDAEVRSLRLIEIGKDSFVLHGLSYIPAGVLLAFLKNNCRSLSYDPRGAIAPVDLSLRTPAYNLLFSVARLLINHLKAIKKERARR